MTTSDNTEAAQAELRKLTGDQIAEIAEQIFGEPDTSDAAEQDLDRKVVARFARAIIRADRRLNAALAPQASREPSEGTVERELTHLYGRWRDGGRPGGLMKLMLDARAIQAGREPPVAKEITQVTTERDNWKRWCQQSEENATEGEAIRLAYKTGYDEGYSDASDGMTDNDACEEGWQQYRSTLQAPKSTEPSAVQFRDALTELLAAGDDCVSGEDGTAALIRFGEADRTARALIAALQPTAGS